MVWRKYRLSSCVFILTGFLLAACQTGPVDSGGRGMQLSEWKVIAASEVDLNFPILIAPMVTKAEYQNRDNQINHHRMVLDSGKGGITTQRIPEAFYNDRTQREFGDIEIFKAELPKFFKEDFVGFEEIRPIKHNSRTSIGFAAIIDLKSPEKDKCFVSKVAYRLKKERTRFIDDTGNADTLVRFRYCDPKVTFDQFIPAMENVDWVTDRAAFVAALAAK